MITSYEITKHKITGDNLWKINDLDLAITDGGLSIMKKFIDENKNDKYTLSIYDEITQKTIEIDATINEMPEIVSMVYRIEHATPLTFIGTNSLSRSYVVGMNITRENIEFGNYKYINKELIKV